MTPHLGSLERVVMDMLWESHEPLSVRDVVDELSRGRRIAYTTVMTILDRLCRKGLVTRDAHGRAFLYTAAASRETYVALLMNEALDTSPDRGAALLHFADTIGEGDADALRRALGGRRRRTSKA